MFTEDDSLARSDASATILVIDDNMTNLAVVTTYLFEHGHNILVAQDGQSGLEKSALAHPNLILLDVDLPDMDGFEVCRRLKATELTSSIPVIFITAHATQTNYKVRGFAVGGVDACDRRCAEPGVPKRDQRERRTLDQPSDIGSGHLHGVDQCERGERPASDPGHVAE